MSKKVDLVSLLAQLDKSISKSLSLSASNSSPLGSLRPLMKFLEYSCHPILWVCGCTVGLWFSNTPESEGVFFNLILGLILEIIFIIILKAALHRQRPSYNESKDMVMAIAAGQFSCPSGHSSRAVFLTLLLMSSTSVWGIIQLIGVAWCICTCASRVMLGRHYVGDVLLGVLLGCFEKWLISQIWAGPETAGWYLSFFKDANNIVIDDL